MNWLENIPPASNIHQVNSTTHGEKSLTSTTPSDSRYPKNSLYDPLYEAMGLPMDPHLRMFLARCDAEFLNFKKVGIKFDKKIPYD
ncbi:hypothetical protein Dsin_001085 [Dipteronia sinensis]|uniref:Uncharacterized protein n=1 Tax=Dipteronia sinensis TaxID=43782 RepID=A0AAE0B4W9_9ROSI|nr:hypothetical protein Dsin_001085 [Dipteronia sinensis]